MLPLKFFPVYFERVWGGRRLEERLGRKLPANVKIGESREISDRKETVSIITEGDFCGRNFREVLSLYGEKIMGPGWTPERRFPILVKWLDCEQMSSIQIHPTAETAKRFDSEKKTEAWFFFDTQPGSEYVAGLYTGTSQERVELALKSDSLESLVLYRKAKCGECVLLEAGIVHAAGAGNLILEIQESSDATYRMYDWHRRDSAGNERELHIEKALASIDYTLNNHIPIRKAHPEETKTLLCECSSFTMHQHVLKAGETLSFPEKEQPRILITLDGKLSLIQPEDADFGVNSYETILLPWESAFTFRAEQDTTLIISENFYTPNTQ